MQKSKARITLTVKLHGHEFHAAGNEETVSNLYLTFMSGIENEPAREIVIPTLRESTSGMDDKDGKDAHEAT